MDKNKVFIFLIMCFLYLIMIFKSLIFLFPIFLMILLKFNILNKILILYAFIVFILFFIISYNNFYAALQFLLIGLFYFSCLPFLANFKEEVYKVNSYLFIVLVFFLVVFGTPYSNYTLYNIFTFSDRFWFDFLGNPFNPNIIAILAALSFISFLERKNYIALIFVFYIFLLCQSRGAFLFLFTYLVITSIKNLKTFLVVLLMLSLSFVLILFNEKLARLNDFSLNGREDRKYYAEQIIRNNFPLGYDISQMQYFINNIGTTDNLYLHLVLKYGVFGLIFLFLIIFPIFVRIKSVQAYAVIISFLIYGFFEDSIIGNMLFLTFFGIAVFEKFFLKRNSKLTG